MYGISNHFMEQWEGMVEVFLFCRRVSLDRESFIVDLTCFGKVFQSF